MSIYDEYQIVINEAQRRLIMRADECHRQWPSLDQGRCTYPFDARWMDAAYYAVQHD